MFVADTVVYIVAATVLYCTDAFIVLFLFLSFLSVALLMLL